MVFELTDSGDRSINRRADTALSTSVEQWQGVSGLNKLNAGMVAAQTTIDQHFGSLQIFEAPARQAVNPPPQLSSTLFSGEYDSPVKLNVQITNVPEVSPAVDSKEWIHHVDAAFSVGASAVKPIEQWLAKPNAINDALIGIGPALDNAVNYYSYTQTDRVAADAQSVFNSARTALENIESTLDRPLTPTERANFAGSVMPLLFFEGNMKEPMHPETVQQLGLNGLKESELSELGILRITRRAGKGGDWPVINERPTPDVVQQASSDGCIAAIGEMLSEGKLKQADIYPEVRTIPERLPKVLGSGWDGRFILPTNEAFNELIGRGKPWGAELRSQFAQKVSMGHMVVVDGIDDAGKVMIRDPQHATRYEMTRDAFMENWSGRTVWR